ncbi:MAG: cytochrome C, partial [Pseudomonadota bacterium]
MMRASLVFALVVAMMPAWAEEFTTFKGHGGPVMALDVAPGGQLVSASFDNSVGLWPGPTWLDGHNAAVVALDASQAPKIFSGGDDFRVLMWQSGKPEPEVVTQHKGKVADIAVFPEGSKLRVASASWDGFINISDMPADLNGEAPTVTTTVLKGHQSNVTSVAYTPAGRLFSTSSDGTLRVWDGERPSALR